MLEGLAIIAGLVAGSAVVLVLERPRRGLCVECGGLEYRRGGCSGCGA